MATVSNPPWYVILGIVLVLGSLPIWYAVVTVREYFTDRKRRKSDGWQL